jgi:hypothetical protein
VGAKRGPSPFAPARPTLAPRPPSPDGLPRGLLHNTRTDARTHTPAPPRPRSGWRFDGAGRCTLIPQIGDPKAHAAATASPRACLRTFPTQVKGTLLFGWLESGPEAEAEAAAKPVRGGARGATGVPPSLCCCRCRWHHPCFAFVTHPIA